jgi:hypothetical protein
LAKPRTDLFQKFDHKSASESKRNTKKTTTGAMRKPSFNALRKGAPLPLPANSLASGSKMNSSSVGLTNTLSGLKVQPNKTALPFKDGMKRKSGAIKAWYNQWQEFMLTSVSFQRILQEFILPKLHKKPFLVSPDDARQRDRYIVIFSLEVLMTLESLEQSMQAAFVRHAAKGKSMISSIIQSNINNNIPVDNTDMLPILIALKRIRLVPQIMTEDDVMRIMYDVLPDTFFSVSPHISTHIAKENSTNNNKYQIKFPQLEWIICVIAYEAVIIALQESKSDNYEV